MSRDDWRESRQTTHSVGPWPEPSVGRERVNHRRPWLQRIRRRLPHLLPTILLALLYLAGSIHLALQHCRIASLLCLVAAAATVAVSRRKEGLPASFRSTSAPGTKTRHELLA